jgi:hypothetical protein
MAYPREFLRLVVSGTLYDVETFSWSLALVDPSDQANPPDTVPAGVLSALTTYHTSTSLNISKAAVMTMVKLNEIGTDGKYTRPNTVYHEFPVPVPGVGNLYPPPQVAIAVSLTTPIKRGRAHAGRFYLPVPSVALGSWGGLTAGTMDTALLAAKTMVNAVNAACSPYKVAVMSNIGEGTFQIVTGVRIGQAYDTMRSRREKIPESYKTLSLT